jgi:two-component system, chemotaxis family, chemotaxis protein CheY
MSREDERMIIQKVLIVDDSSTSRMITKRCLEIAGFRGIEFCEAEDGLKALAFLRKQRVDLVLSDLKMPKMDGTTFIRKLKLDDATRDLPVIVISSMGNDVTEKQLENEGVAGIIRKPVSPEKITATISGVFGAETMESADEDEGDILGGIL